MATKGERKKPIGPPARKDCSESCAVGGKKEKKKGARSGGCLMCGGCEITGNCVLEA
ncbi:MAG: hypothetical protein LLG06_04730 [Desulfobacteraceae bacterium]|nr:hypothetical protein [Desulfobacteraceae bacterium]